MTYIFRPGASFVTATEQARVFQPGGAAAALPWWNPDGATPAANCGAWQAKAAASLAASYLNLATLGNANIDPAVVGGVAPTWDAVNGWIFNGVAQYLISGLTVASGWSALIRFSNGPALLSATILFGCVNTTAPATRWYIYPNHTSAGVRYGHGGAINIVPGVTAGVLGMAGQLAYRNGIFDGNIPADGVAFLPTFIGCANQMGVPLFFIQANIQAIAFYNVGLTAPQVLARYNAMALL